MEFTSVKPYRNGLRLSTTVAVVLVILSTFLIALRVEQVLLDLAQARGTRTAQKFSAAIEHGFQLGLGLYDQSNLENDLSRQAEVDSAQRWAALLNEQGEIITQTGDSVWFQQVKPVWTAQLLGQHGPRVPLVSRVSGSIAFNGVPVTDTTGRVVGVFWLVHDRSGLRAEGGRIIWQMLPQALLAMLVLALLWGAITFHWMKNARERLARAQAAILAADPGQTAVAVMHQVDGVTPLPGVHPRKGHEMLLLGAALVSCVLVLSGLVYAARDLARPLVLSQVNENTTEVAQAAAARVNRALSLGIPAAGLVGVDGVFSQELKAAPEVAFLALRWNDGQGAQPVLVVQAGQSDELTRAARVGVADAGADGIFQQVRVPLAHLGEVVAGTPLAFVDRSITSILVDLLFAVVVALVLIRELLGRAWASSLLKPLIGFEGAWQGWRLRALSDTAVHTSASLLKDIRAGVQDWSAQLQQRIDRRSLAGVDIELVMVRLVVFFTALSEELMRPFFAVFASEVNPVALGMSPTMLAGLPVAVFMLTLAIAQPLGPWIVRHVEVRRALALSALWGAGLLAATALTRDGLILVLLRGLSGITYGLMLILAQTLIVRITSQAQRARGLVEVSAAIVAAGVCGPALGGLIAERAGHVATLLVCAACMGVSALSAWFLAPIPTSSAEAMPTPGNWHAMLAVMRQYRVMAVTWFAAVPARLAAAALLVVVTPLYLLEIGQPVTISGRVLLLYFLCFMITAPLAARWSDLSQRRKPWIVLGCALSAAACLALPLISGVWGAAVCCGLLGVAQALLSAPQLALVTEAFDGQESADRSQGATPEQALAAFRLIERVGSVVAPFVVAAAVSQLGLTGAVGAIGLLLAVGTVGVWIGLWGYQDAADRT